MGLINWLLPQLRVAGVGIGGKGNPGMKKGVKLGVKGQEKGSVWKEREWGQGWCNLGSC